MAGSWPQSRSESEELGSGLFVAFNLNSLTFLAHVSELFQPETVMRRSSFRTNEFKSLGRCQVTNVMIRHYVAVRTAATVSRRCCDPRYPLDSGGNCDFFRVTSCSGRRLHNRGRCVMRLRRQGASKFGEHDVGTRTVVTSLETILNLSMLNCWMSESNDRFYWTRWP